MCLNKIIVPTLRKRRLGGSTTTSRMWVLMESAVEKRLVLYLHEKKDSFYIFNKRLILYLHEKNTFLYLHKKFYFMFAWKDWFYICMKKNVFYICMKIIIFNWLNKKMLNILSKWNGTLKLHYRLLYKWTGQQKFRILTRINDFILSLNTDKYIHSACQN